MVVLKLIILIMGDLKLIILSGEVSLELRYSHASHAKKNILILFSGIIKCVAMILSQDRDVP